MKRIRRVSVSRRRASDELSVLERSDYLSLVREHLVSGVGIDELSELLGLPRSEIESYVRRLMLDDEFLSDFIEYRLRYQLLRLDGLWRAIWPRASQGDVGAVLAAIRVLERESRLLGLDAAEKRIVRHEVSPLQEFARLVFGGGSGSARALGSGDSFSLGGDVAEAEYGVSEGGESVGGYGSESVAGSVGCEVCTDISDL